MVTKEEPEQKVMPTKDFRVAVIGGGICGTVCTYALSKAGLNVQLFEAVTKFEEIGAGVGIGPNACRALEALGLLAAVVAQSDESEPSFRGFQFVSGEQSDLVIYDVPEYQPEDAGIGIYRPAFLDAVTNLLDPSLVHFNKRCTFITISDKTNVIHFADGSTYEAHLVIGADGIKSVTRGVVASTNELHHIAFGNTTAYRGLIPTEQLKKDGMKRDMTHRPTCFVGLHKHIISFPIKGGSVINVVAFKSNYDEPIGSTEVPLSRWREPVSEEEVVNAYEGWDEDPMMIVRNLRKPNKWSIHVVQPSLKSFVHRKIVLIGDAAHGMMPHLGAGAGQGLEDICVLTRLLTHPQTKLSNLEDVLRAYDAVRRPRANAVKEMSANAGRLYDSYGPGKLGADELRDRLKGLWLPVWHHDLGADVEGALKQLEHSEVFD